MPVNKPRTTFFEEYGGYEGFKSHTISLDAQDVEEEKDGLVSRAFRRGFHTYVPGMAGGLLGFAGSLSKIDTLRDYGFGVYERSMERAGRFERDVPALSEVLTDDERGSTILERLKTWEGADNPINFSKWVVESGVELLPQLALMATNVGAVSSVGSKAGLFSAGSLVSKGSTELGKNALKKRVASVASKQKVSTEAAQKIVQEQALLTAGTGLSIFNMYAGSNWAEVYQELGVDAPGSAAFSALGAAATAPLGASLKLMEGVLGKEAKRTFIKAVGSGNTAKAKAILKETFNVASRAALEEYWQESLATINLLYNDPEVAETYGGLTEAYIANAGRPLGSAATIAAGSGPVGGMIRGMRAERTKTAVNDPDKIINEHLPNQDLVDTSDTSTDTTTTELSELDLEWERQQHLTKEYLRKRASGEQVPLTRDQQLREEAVAYEKYQPTPPGTTSGTGPTQAKTQRDVQLSRSVPSGEEGPAKARDAVSVDAFIKQASAYLKNRNREGFRKLAANTMYNTMELTEDQKSHVDSVYKAAVRRKGDIETFLKHYYNSDTESVEQVVEDINSGLEGSLSPDVRAFWDSLGFEDRVKFFDVMSTADNMSEIENALVSFRDTNKPPVTKGVQKILSDADKQDKLNKASITPKRAFKTKTTTDTKDTTKPLKKDLKPIVEAPKEQLQALKETFTKSSLPPVKAVKVKAVHGIKEGMRDEVGVKGDVVDKGDVVPPAVVEKRVEQATKSLVGKSEFTEGFVSAILKGDVDSVRNFYNRIAGGKEDRKTIFNKAASLARGIAESYNIGDYFTETYETLKSAVVDTQKEWETLMGKKGKDQVKVVSDSSGNKVATYFILHTGTNKRSVYRKSASGKDELIVETKTTTEAKKHPRVLELIKQDESTRTRATKGKNIPAHIASRLVADGSVKVAEFKPDITSNEMKVTAQPVENVLKTLKDVVKQDGDFDLAEKIDSLIKQSPEFTIRVGDKNSWNKKRNRLTIKKGSSPSSIVNTVEKALERQKEVVKEVPVDKTKEKSGTSPKIIIRKKADKKDPSFIRDAVQVKNRIDIKNLQGMVDEETKGWSKKPDVVENVNKLPPSLRLKMMGLGGLYAKGVYDPKTKHVYLIADNIEKNDNIREIVVHEVVGHFGIEQALNEMGLPKDKIVKTLMKSSDQHIAKAREIAESREGPGMSDLVFLKETLAILHETGAKFSFLDRLVGLIKQFIRKHTGLNLSVSLGDIALLFSRAESFAKSGIVVPTPASEVMQQVYFMNAEAQTNAARLGKTKKKDRVLVETDVKEAGKIIRSEQFKPDSNLQRFKESLSNNFKYVFETSIDALKRMSPKITQVAITAEATIANRGVYLEHLVSPWRYIEKNYIYSNPTLAAEYEYLWNNFSRSARHREYMFKWLEKNIPKDAEIRPGRAVQYNAENLPAWTPTSAVDAFKNGLLKAVDMLGQEAVELGITPAYEQGTYLPTSVGDIQGFIAEITKTGREDVHIVNKILTKHAKSLGKSVKDLTESEKRVALSDSFLEGRYQSIKIPGTLKEQTIPFVYGGLVRFYAKPYDIMQTHLRELNDHLVWRKALGQTPRASIMKTIQKLKAEQAQILLNIKEQNEVGPMVEEYQKRLSEIESEIDLNAEKLETANDVLTESIPQHILQEVKPEHYSRMMEILHARLNMKGAHGWMASVRNLLLMTTLPSVTNALTQLGDQGFNLAEHGAKYGMGGIAKALSFSVPKDQRKTSKLFNFRQAAADFPTGRLADAVSWLFKKTGLTSVDLFGKESFLNAEEAQIKDWVKTNNRKAFDERFSITFDQQFRDKVWNELKNDIISFDFHTMLYGRIMDIHPINPMSQTAAWMEAGNFRTAYILKTFGIRALNRAFTVAARHIKNAKRPDGSFDVVEASRGVTQAIYLLALLALIGATADEMKDALTGRNVRFSDNLEKQMAMLMFMNMYSVDQGRERGSLASSILAQAAPPLGVFDNILHDVDQLLFKQGENFQARTLANMPIAGNIIRTQVTPWGVEARIKSRERRIKEYYKQGVSMPYIRRAVKEFNAEAKSRGLSEYSISLSDLRRLERE